MKAPIFGQGAAFRFADDASAAGSGEEGRDDAALSDGDDYFLIPESSRQRYAADMMMVTIPGLGEFSQGAQDWLGAPEESGTPQVRADASAGSATGSVASAAYQSNVQVRDVMSEGYSPADNFGGVAFEPPRENSRTRGRAAPKATAAAAEPSSRSSRKGKGAGEIAPMHGGAESVGGTPGGLRAPAARGAGRWAPAAAVAVVSVEEGSEGSDEEEEEGVGGGSKRKRGDPPADRLARK